jgi:hypothetical protein
MKTLESIQEIKKNFKENKENSIEIINEELVCVRQNENPIELNINEIKRIHLNKRRNLNINYLLFIIGSLLAIASHIIKYNYTHLNLIGYQISALLIVYALIKKSYYYKLFIITRPHHLISVSINETLKDETMEMVKFIKEKTKNHNYINIIR